MKGGGYLQSIIWHHKYRLSMTYLLFSLEMGGDLLKPYFIGKAVNDLLKGQYLSLLILLGLHVGWMTVGIIRMRYDVRTYTSIYNSVMLKFLSGKTARQDVSRLSAHSTLTRELIDFLEYDLVYILEALFNIFGSIILLFLYDKQVVILCVAVLLPIYWISRRYSKRMSKLTHHKNNEIEKQVDAIASFDAAEINRHYHALRKWQIRMADQQAFNFGIMEGVVALMIGLALYISTRHSQIRIDQGELIGIYFYIVRFNKGLETVPYILEKYVGLRDIILRLIQAE